MAKYRIATLQAETASTAGTDVIAINLKEPISRIQIKFDVNAASMTFAAHPSADVTKIELVDGSDVLFSMSGAECMALNIYDRECSTMIKGNFYNANDIISQYGLDFGRFLYDPELALDPTKFDNLQLKLTYVLTNCNAAASSGTTEIKAWVFDEKKITPSGFLMSKEIFAYTCGAQHSYKYIDLPLDYPIRKLIFRAYRAGYQPCDQISEFMIDENTGENVVMDWYCESYFEFMRAAFWKPVSESIQVNIENGTTYVYITATQYWTDFMMQSTSAEIVWPDSWGKSNKVPLVGTAGGSATCHASGYLPNHCFEVPFGNPQVIDDWYDTAGKKQVRLRLKAGSSTTNGTAQVVLQQYRTY